MNPLDNTPQGNKKAFFGEKRSQLGINVNSAGDNQLLYKNDYDASLETYYGTNGAVMQEGRLPTGGYGLRFPDANGVGIAQFGQFPDGSTALKVAKPGVEVATAPNSQLIFNSNQDILKVIQSGVIQLTLPNSGFVVNAGAYTTNVTFPTQTNTPAVIAYFNMAGNNLTIGGFPLVTGNPQALPYTAAISTSTIIGVFFDITVSTLTFYFNQLVQEAYAILPVVTFNYFILQESIS